jgi:glucokinase
VPVIHVAALEREAYTGSRLHGGTWSGERGLRLLLVGDFGATHARLALISPAAGIERPAHEANFPSQRYDSLEAVVAEFLESGPRIGIERAVFAVAGPVVRGRAEVTNLGWVVDEEVLATTLGVASVRLLNDLVALAYGVPQLGVDAVRTLNAGEPEERGPIAVVAPGTGLGQAYLSWDGAGYRARPSEGGHGDFAPGDALQAELQAWMWRRFDHVSYERVCSGSGIPNLYDFLEERGVAPEEPSVRDRLAAAEDRSPVIVEAAFDERVPSALCLATLELFASILAAEAGNAALRGVATGGVYLGGGMPRRVLPLLERPSFIERFRRKGRMSEFVGRIPLHVIVARGTALRGAAYVARAESEAGVTGKGTAASGGRRD